MSLVATDAVTLLTLGVVIIWIGQRAHLPEDRNIPVKVTPTELDEYEFTRGMNM
ncbi:MAG: hypothetical protein M3416_00550 [Acidobacteriota bacterium]|nr:hypothetical protein [Acidobacteriota bacterium]